MKAEEKEAKELIKQHVSKDAPSYQNLSQGNFYGFMGYYLSHSKNNQTMSTTADHDVTIKLAKIDKLRDDKKERLLSI